MKTSAIALLALAAAAGSPALAQSVEANIKKMIEPRLAPGTTVLDVRATPYSGLYEVNTGFDIVYTDKDAQFIIAGHVYSAKTSEDLTKSRLDEFNKIKFSELPLNQALKLVKGNGKRVIALFEDPHCGYCKQFRRTTLKEIDNVTVYTFMYNILSPDSLVKSKNIWCAPDRNKAWDEWMLENKEAPAAKASCVSPHDTVFALGRKLRVTATPAIYFADGSRIINAIDTKTLEAKLATVK